MLVEDLADLLRVLSPVDLFGGGLEMLLTVGDDGPHIFEVGLELEDPRVGRERTVGHQKRIGFAQELKPGVLRLQRKDRGLGVLFGMARSRGVLQKRHHLSMRRLKVGVERVLIGHRPFDVFVVVGRQRRTEVLAHPDVVHNRPAGLGVTTAAVGPRDGLEQVVVRERTVQVHGLLDGRIKAREQLVADNQHLERMLGVFEVLDGGFLFALIELVLHKLWVLVLVVLGGRVDAHAHGRCFRLGVCLAHALHGLKSVGDDSVQLLFVDHTRRPVDGDDLRLEAIGQHMLSVVGPDIEGDFRNARPKARQVTTGHAPCFDLFHPLFGFVGEVLVKEDVQLSAFEMPLGEPALVVDRHRRPVIHRILNAVLVEVALARHAKVAEGVLVALFDRRPRKAKAHGVGQHRPHVRAQVLFLGAVGLVYHHDPVL